MKTNNKVKGITSVKDRVKVELTRREALVLQALSGSIASDLTINPFSLKNRMEALGISQEEIIQVNNDLWHNLNESV